MTSGQQKTGLPIYVKELEIFMAPIDSFHSSVSFSSLTTAR
jgi:hypothetical protein